MAKRAAKSVNVPTPRGFLGYIRVSTDDQAESGLGMDAQREAIAMYAKLYQLELLDIIVDDGFSGADLDRPGVQDALRRLQSGAVEGLLVSKLDRLSRSVKDVGALVETYFAAGKARLVSVGEQFDTGTAAGRLILNILSSVAQWEREAISERTSAALRVKVARGEHLGTAPYGQRYDVEQHCLVPYEQEQSAIAQILALDAAGLSTVRIAEVLTERGVAARGKQWYQAAVWRLLSKHRTPKAA